MRVICIVVILIVSGNKHSYLRSAFFFTQARRYGHMPLSVNRISRFQTRALNHDIKAIIAPFILKHKVIVNCRILSIYAKYKEIRLLFMLMQASKGETETFDVVCQDHVTSQ